MEIILHYLVGPNVMPRTLVVEKGDRSECQSNSLEERFSRSLPTLKMERGQMLKMLATSSNWEKQESRPSPRALRRTALITPGFKPIETHLETLISRNVN